MTTDFTTDSTTELPQNDLTAYTLADNLYQAGYQDRHSERSYDPRGNFHWQAMADFCQPIQRARSSLDLTMFQSHMAAITGRRKELRLAIETANKWFWANGRESNANNLRAVERVADWLLFASAELQGVVTNELIAVAIAHKDTLQQAAALVQQNQTLAQRNDELTREVTLLRQQLYLLGVDN